MYVFKKEDKDINIYKEEGQKLNEIALNTDSEEELLELLKIENPFINRKIGDNKNLTVKVMYIMLCKYPAYTMCVKIAKNKNITSEMIVKLYEIASTIYKESMLREDLDSIFNKKLISKNNK